MAKLVDFSHHFESAAQDDALDILSIVLSDLSSKTKRINSKNRLRMLKDLDMATETLSNACKIVLDKNNQFNRTAYIFFVLNKLQASLKRRDIFVNPSKKYSDPKANLHGGKEWESIRPIICRSLSLTIEPHNYLQGLVNELDETYKIVSRNFDNNPFIRFDLIKGNEELILTQLDKLDEPDSLKLLRKAIKSRLPRVDLPEVLLEIAARTDFITAFTHINEGNARAADLEISICAVLLAQACNIGFEPFVREDIPALKRD